VDKLEERKFRLHARQKGYQDRISDAQEYVRKAFDRFDNPVLEFSGGKDSLVMLHLVAERCGYKDVDVFHFEQAYLSVPGTSEFVEETVEQYGGRLFKRAGEAVTDDNNNYWDWYYRLKGKRDWDVRLLGIRAGESSKRRDRADFSSGIPMAKQVSDEPDTAVFPVFELSTTDVWAYIVENDVEYHEIYDKQGELYGDMENRANRLTTFHDADRKNFGNREISQHLYPGKANKLKDIEQRGGVN